MLYERIFRKFNSNRLKYLIIGGIAVNLHGFFRATGDLDILIALDDDNIQKFIKSVKSLRMLPKIPVKIDDFARADKRASWIKEKNLKVFSLYNPKDSMEQLDVMAVNYIDFQKAYTRKEAVNLSGIKLPLIAINDLIKLKKISARERDIIDINALNKIKKIKNE